MHYLVGDIHGNYQGLLEVLDACAFHKGKDVLYAVGDYFDGPYDLPDTLQVYEYLKDLGNSFQGILGNHDLGFLDYIYNDFNMFWSSFQEAYAWLQQGGSHTLQAFGKRSQEVAAWLRTLPLYRKIDISSITQGRYENLLLLHGGLPVYRANVSSKRCLAILERYPYLEKDSKTAFRELGAKNAWLWKSSLEETQWDRSLFGTLFLYYIKKNKNLIKEDLEYQDVSRALRYSVRAREPDSSLMKRIASWIGPNLLGTGHTTTQVGTGYLSSSDTYQPFSLDIPSSGTPGKFLNLDTGGGWGGKISLYCIENNTYYQSALASSYYPDFAG